jgi:hypothetical protein
VTRSAEAIAASAIASMSAMSKAVSSHPPIHPEPGPIRVQQFHGTTVGKVEHHGSFRAPAHHITGLEVEHDSLVRRGALAAP